MEAPSTFWLWNIFFWWQNNFFPGWSGFFFPGQKIFFFEGPALSMSQCPTGGSVGVCRVEGVEPSALIEGLLLGLHVSWTKVCSAANLRIVFGVEKFPAWLWGWQAISRLQDTREREGLSHKGKWSHSPSSQGAMLFQQPAKLTTIFPQSGFKSVVPCRNIKQDHLLFGYSIYGELAQNECTKVLQIFSILSF